MATVWRYVREAVDLLAGPAPSLTAALWRLAHNGHQLGILDRSLIATDRLGGHLDRLYYSGKHRHHGVNLQGLVDPRRGDLVWISDGLPGSTHDLTAARTHGIIAVAQHAEVELLANKGYQGAGGTVTSPHKGRKLTAEQKAHNRMVNSLRGPGRTWLRHPQDLADLHQGPLLPSEGRPARQSRTHPRTRDRIMRLEKAH